MLYVTLKCIAVPFLYYIHTYLITKLHNYFVVACFGLDTKLFIFPIANKSITYLRISIFEIPILPTRKLVQFRKAIFQIYPPHSCFEK